MTDNSEDLLNALIAKATGELKMSEYNFIQYMNNPAAIGEHGEIAEEAMVMVDKIIHEQDRIEYLDALKQLKNSLAGN